MASRSGAPETEETVVFPDWVMFDRKFGSTDCHDGHAAADEAVNNDDTAAAVHTSSGHSCYLSFALAAPPKISYLNLHWPERAADESGFRLPAYPFVLAADDNLVLLRVSISSMHRSPSDLFVYAAGPPPSSPSAVRLPTPSEDSVHSLTFVSCEYTIGILRLAAGDQDRGYIVADLDVSAREKRVSPRRRNDADTTNNNSGDGRPMFVRLRVFSSETGSWRLVTKRAPRSNGVEFPSFWTTNDVLPLDGRFLCWVDNFHGLLLSDFSKISSPALHFVPFPGKQYAYEKIRSSTRSFPGMFRSVSVSQGSIRFVHIDNDFHDKDEWNSCDDCRERKRQKLGTKITIWTLIKNMVDGGGNSRFEWEVHRVINLECLWAQIGYQDQGLPRRLPEFPVIAADDPDVLCCVLNEEWGHGKAWMIMVDMKYAYLRSCAPCVNGNVPLLPSVVSKYLKMPTVN